MYGEGTETQILFKPQSPEFLSVGDLNIDKNSDACVLTSINYNATYILIEYKLQNCTW